MGLSAVMPALWIAIRRAYRRRSGIHWRIGFLILRRFIKLSEALCRLGHLSQVRVHRARLFSRRSVCGQCQLMSIPRPVSPLHIQPVNPSLPDAGSPELSSATVSQTLVSLRQKLNHAPELLAEVAAELEQLQCWQQDLEWLHVCQQHSHFLIATVDMATLRLQALNDQFHQLLKGLSRPEEATATGYDLLAVLPETDQHALRQRYRRHVLYAVLQAYGIDSPGFERLLNESVVVQLPDPDGLPPRSLELWFRQGNLRILPSDELAQHLHGLGLDITQPNAEASQVLKLASMAAVEEQFEIHRCSMEGHLLLEGLEISERQTIHDLTQLLIDRESILQPAKFQRVNHLMRSLFRADNSLILSAENEQARLFMGLDQTEWTTKAYAMPSLQDSYFLKAAEANQILNIPDLTIDTPTTCEQDVQATGARSLLIIPLVMKSTVQGSTLQSKLVGLVGLTSDRPYHFDRVDYRNAQDLIPALTAAVRHAIQRRFNNIHPAVEWRFAQEAERRSWGLPPEPIIFNTVYPLYGISDIRGSSEERNRAIQSDLLTQFQLGLNVIEAVCETTSTAFGHQLKLDLEEQVAHLQQGITVDAEVTQTRYLKERLESHFSYFRQCSPEAHAAVEAYLAACDPVQGCVYQARARYDQTIQQINGLLRETWARWQTKMQQVIQHYCDIEATDGIDHMIYAGASIDPNFCTFHLHSLRYDQLRAVCDCARTSFDLKAQLKTDLDITHLVLVQATTVDIFHDETTERLFDVRGTRDTRYEIVKKRIDKAMDTDSQTRITQPGKLTLVYSTAEEWEEYKQYFRYLAREGWIGEEIEFGLVEPLQGVTGLRFARVQVLPAS